MNSIRNIYYNPNHHLNSLLKKNISNNLIFKKINKQTKLNQEISYVLFPSKSYNSFTINEYNFNKSTKKKVNLNYLLPSKSKIDIDKKTLILDLDETLIHSYIIDEKTNSNKIYGNYSFKLNYQDKNIKKDIIVIVRPHLKEFLETVSKIFEIVIFTASVEEYASPLIDIIDINKICKYRLYRDDCVLVNGIFIKDLKLLNRDLKDIIIIDNSSKSFSFHPQNGIKIKSFVDDLNDKELIYLIPILKFLSKVDDVRNFIHKIQEFSFETFKNYEIIIDCLKKGFYFKKIVSNKKNNLNFSEQKFNNNFDDDFDISGYIYKNKNENKNKIKIKNINLLKFNYINKKVNQNKSSKKINLNLINKRALNNNDYLYNKLYNIKNSNSVDKIKLLNPNNSYTKNLNVIKINKIKKNDNADNQKLTKNYSFNEENLNLINKILMYNNLKLNSDSLKYKKNKNKYETKMNLINKRNLFQFSKNYSNNKFNYT